MLLQGARCWFALPERPCKWKPETGKAEAEAVKLAERLYTVGPGSLARAKALVLAAYKNDLATQLDLEAEEMANAQGSAESGEGISAFLEKRKANFPGN